MSIGEEEYQRSLVQCILSDDDFPDGKRLYKNNWQENAHRALSVSFPTVRSLLGEDNFRIISRHACASIAKTEYDWGEWAHNELGTVIKHCLQRQGLFESMEYVIDCAALDSALFLCQRSKNPELDTDSLSLLQCEDPDALYLEMADNLQWLSSTFPLLSIYEFVHGDKTDSSAIKTQINHARKQKLMCHFLVSRTGFAPEIDVLSASELTLYQLATNHTNIASLFDTASNAGLDFSNWLGEAISRKHLVGVKPI